ITAFTEAKIEDDQIARPGDFISLTPNVNLTTVVRPGESDVSMRGIQGDFGLTQPVAVVVDGVVEANPNALDQELIDVQQIEVVKGPQGALYGRNANAGAIIINTLAPSDDFTGKIVVGGGNGDTIKGQALVSGPIIPGELFGRLALSEFRQDGFWNDATVGRPADPHDEKIADARVIWKPNGDLTVDLRARGSNVQQGAQLWDVQVAPFQEFNANNYFPAFQMNNAQVGHQDRAETAVRVDYSMPFAKLTVIGSYDAFNSDYVGDGPLLLTGPGGAGGPPLVFVDPGAVFGANPPLLPGYSYSRNDGNGYNMLDETDLTFEARLTSPSDQPFRWMAGGYYAHSNRFTYDDGRVDNGTVIEQPLGAALSPGSINPIIDISTDEKDINKDYAMFGQVQYDILPSLEGEASLRWDEEDKFNRNLIPPGNSPVTGAPLTDPVLAPSGFARQTSFYALQPKFTLRYKPTDDISLYASYGRGFRSGGYNPLGSAAQVKENNPIFNFPENYPGEKSDAYEIGIKSDWLNRRLRINGALFYTDVTNAQSFTAFPAPIVTIVASLPKTHAEGFELETTYLLTPDLRVTESFGLTDARIDQSTLMGVIDKRIPLTPDYQNSLSLDYDTALPWSDLSLISHVDWQLTGPTWFDVFNTPGTGRDTFSLVNARVAIEGTIGGNTWQLAGWGKNLLNKYYNVYDAPVPPLANFNYRGVPRTFGVDLIYKF
ncbi:MAG TPA: TonB-dependent receptor, partial [Stellaceae bacterium]|nr:TonB-dependent receptor [Stellaceae bacterium]